IAKNLRAPVIIVLSGDGKTTAQVVNGALTAVHNFEGREIHVLGLVVNKIKQEHAADVEELLRSHLSSQILLTVIQEDKRLQSPTMKERGEKLNGKLLF